MSMSLKEQLQDAIMEFDEELLQEICQKALNESQTTPEELLVYIGEIMKVVGDLYQSGEFYLPELIGASSAVQEAIDKVLDPAIKTRGSERNSHGKVVIGTVEGDVHSIGKDLVGSFLFANGFEVFNLGVEVPAKAFIDKAEEVGATVIGLSSLLTMSMGFQQEVIKELNARGLRDKYKVIVGGSPTTQDWAKQIGADGWADDAVEAVLLVKQLLGIPTE